MWASESEGSWRAPREHGGGCGAQVGDINQWRQSAFGDDGNYTSLQGQSASGDDGQDTRLQGHQATSVLQTVRGEAGSITVERRAGGCQASARRETEVGCRRRRRRVPRDRRGALATSQLPAWRALVLPLQLHHATNGNQAGFTRCSPRHRFMGGPWP